MFEQKLFSECKSLKRMGSDDNLFANFISPLPTAWVPKLIYHTTSLIDVHVPGTCVFVHVHTYWGRHFAHGKPVLLLMTSH